MAQSHQIDLNSLSAADLTGLIEQAKAELEKKKEGARAALLDEMTSKAAALGLSLDGLLGSKKSPRTNVRQVRSDRGSKLGAKYRSPNGEEWTGRGRKPLWLTKFEEQGKKREEFLV